MSVLCRIDLRHPDDPRLAQSRPDCFDTQREARSAAIDPRHLPCASRPEADLAGQADFFASWWSDRLGALVESGVRGFLVRHPHNGLGLWASILPKLHRQRQDLLLIAETPGLARAELATLGRTFDHVLSSLPWWDFRASWLAEEYDALAKAGAVLSPVEMPGQPAAASAEARRSRILLAPLLGDGWLLPWRWVQEDESLAAAARTANSLAVPAGRPHILSTRAHTIVLRAPGPGSAGEAVVAVVNTGPAPAPTCEQHARDLLGDWTDLTPVADAAPGGLMRPQETRLFRAQRARPVRLVRRNTARYATEAAQKPRIVIAQVSPAVDGGAFPAKCLAGETLTFSADILIDGHQQVAAELLLRAEDERNWQRVRLLPRGNDRWSAELQVRRTGRHLFVIEAWLDSFGTYIRDLSRKVEANQAVAQELLEGRQMVEAAAKRGTRTTAPALGALLKGFDLPAAELVTLLQSPETQLLLHKADARQHRTQCALHALDADRPAAVFSSWYELFPRSQGGDAARHGRFADVIGRLPAIRDMGFDVLYLPPIHPVGSTNRKGRNNALRAADGDPGSVYAIGSAAGGHEAVHPELGTLEDFRILLAAARDQGLEIALDFAVQCSPDHPWLTEHPGWFDWRPDGTIKYAENPPKKYEDIVNVDFYAKDAVPGLWLALRDVVLFWIEQGVRIFRVDNPHTKPFPFWRWLIADIRSAHADVIFLSEAFTRPKVMHHLAKIGFQQSYTYFTWRNTKAELTAYIRELTDSAAASFFRPHFFTNTPDINPYFLQTSGRAGFLIRAALAATLSSLWGIYSGFELCESDALPGREEYAHSEKYEIKPRDWAAPGNIIAEITQLNRLRRTHPVLQDWRGTTFHTASNDSVLYFARHRSGFAEQILVLVSLDPHQPQRTEFEVPLWTWNLPDDAAVAAEDLLHGGVATWRGKIQSAALRPDEPYRLWRVAPAGGGGA